MKTLFTDQLTLHPLRPENVERLCAILGDPKITEYLFSGKPLTASEAGAFISKEFTDETKPTGLGVLTENATGCVIGFAGLLECSYLGAEDYEIGFVLIESARGKNYAQEIGLRQIRFGFEELACRRLLALAHPNNAPSRTVLEKLGMKIVREIEIEGRGPRLIYFLDRVIVDNEKVS